MAWAPDYCTADELKQFARIDDTVDDDEVALAISGASRAIDKATGRQFGQVATAEAREFEAVWDRRRRLYVVEIDDLHSVTGFGIADANGDTVAVTATEGDGGYRLQPRNAAQKSQPWTQFTISASTTTWYTVTGLFGWASVPDTIRQATLLQANRVLKRRDAPFGVAGSPEIGSEIRLLARLDPDVQLMIGPYRRWWAAL